MAGNEPCAPFPITLPRAYHPLMNETVILTQPEVRTLLPMRSCMDLMATTLASLGREEGTNPLRFAMWAPDRRGLIVKGFASLAVGFVLALFVAVALEIIRRTRAEDPEDYQTFERLKRETRQDLAALKARFRRGSAGG